MRQPKNICQIHFMPKGKKKEMCSGYFTILHAGLNDIRIAFSCIEESDISALFEVMYKCAMQIKNTI